MCTAILVVFTQLTCGAAYAGIRPLVGAYAAIKVKKGETLEQIARREDVNLQLLSKLNHLRSGHPAAGRKLILPTLHILPREPAEGIVLNIPERQVYLFRGGKMKATYPVAVGKSSWPTETGEFTLASKVVNPKWKPTKEMVEREDIKDDPVPPGKDNPVGDRWMGWSKKGFGFHSTKTPESVGQVITHGCIRLYPEAAHKMFDLVKEGETIYSIYEPILVGQRDGNYYLVVYPDIYNKKTATLTRARTLLKTDGILSRVNMKEVADIVRNQDGYPHKIGLLPEKRLAKQRPPTKKKPANSMTGKKQKKKPEGKSATNDRILPDQKVTMPARRQGTRLMTGYRRGSLRLLRPERELPQLQQVANQGYYLGPEDRVVQFAPELLSALNQLLLHSTPLKPLVILSLYRPSATDRMHEPHGNGLAVDIAAFAGHTIDSHKPQEAVAGVESILRALSPGRYRMGLPKPPDTDPAGLMPPPDRPQYWPFFPAPVPDVTQFGSVTLVTPHLTNEKLSFGQNGEIRSEVLRWENERAAPISELGDAGMRKTLEAVRKRGVEIGMCFPDAVDHVHLDVARLPVGSP